MAKPHAPLTCKADVYALDLAAETKAVLHFVLEQPPKPFDRDALAVLLGMKAAQVEIGVKRGQIRHPPLFAVLGPDGKRIGASVAYIPPGHEVRRAWGTSEAPPRDDVEVPQPSAIDFDGDPDVVAYRIARHNALVSGRHEREAGILAKRAAAAVRAGGDMPIPLDAPEADPVVSVIEATEEPHPDSARLGELLDLLQGEANLDESAPDVLARIIAERNDFRTVVDLHMAPPADQPVKVLDADAVADAAAPKPKKVRLAKGGE